jgi:hypothetical protein
MIRLLQIFKNCGSSLKTRTKFSKSPFWRQSFVAFVNEPADIRPTPLDKTFPPRHPECDGI